MGLLSRLKRLVKGPPEPTRPTVTEVTAGMADRGQRYIIEQLDPGLRKGFDRLASTLISEIHRSEERMVQRLSGLIDDKLQIVQQPTIQRITKEEVLAEFEKDKPIYIRDLKKKLKATSSALRNHLKRLEDDGMITRVKYGEYRKADKKGVAKTPPTSDENIKNGLRLLFD